MYEPDHEQGKAAGRGGKQGQQKLEAMVLVGHAPLKGAQFAMRYAGTVEPFGGGDRPALPEPGSPGHRIAPSGRGDGILPAVEALRATLTERERRP